MQDVWGEDARGDYVWSAGNVREAIPDVMTPCTWSAVQRYIEESAGPRIQAGHPLFGLIAGRLYMNMSVSATAAQRMGASWLLDQISTQAFGTIPDDIVVAPVDMSRVDVLRTVGAHQMRVRLWTLANGLRLERLLRDFVEACDRLLDEVPAVDSAQELLDLWRDRITPVFDRACKLVRFSAPAWMAMAVHYRIICALVGEANANVVTSGSTANGDLASLDLLLSVEELRAGRLDERTFARRYGHRGPHEHELFTPRPGEDPNWIAEQLRAPTAPPTARSALKRQQQQRADTWRTIRETNRVRYALARWQARSWGRAARRRERTRSEATKVFWVLRAFVERAGQLTGHGQDLYMLTIDEITHVLAGDHTPLAHVDERRAVYEQRCAMAEPPVVFRGPIDDTRPSPAQPGAETRPDVLAGQPGAPGTVTAVARVIHDIADAGKLQQGEILVTRLTNVGWTPLFMTAGAIVTDIGAVLSHAAIVAREIGLPAVVGTGNSTSAICTGDMLTVDGLAGTVTIVDRSGEASSLKRQRVRTRSAAQPRPKRVQPLRVTSRPTSGTSEPTVLLPATGLCPNDLGGKGAALNRLIALGAAVPSAGVVTTTAYRRFVAGAGLTEFTARLAAGRAVSADEINAAFLNAAMDPETERAICDLARTVGGTGSLAVRSSATSEDSEGASGAGQYLTILNVPCHEAVRSVRLVWASLWHPAPSAYRSRTGNAAAPEIAVLLMPMIDSELAGVIFTRDPVGSPDNVRVEAVRGTAEDLVAGSRSPESWVLPRTGNEASSSRVVDDVIATSLELEEQLGGPQDIEWAHDGDRLWILQARPITS